MKIDILSLFPEMFDGFLSTSIIKRAIENKLVDLNIVNFRDYSLDKHNKVDDTPYGGGAGMVLTCQPIFDCIEDIKTADSFIVMMTPQGELYKQSTANQLLNKKHIIILCGHYEGFDERIRSLVDLEISIGDFVLTGGELPAMTVADSMIRLISGSINNISHEEDSHSNWMLEHPHYTKPSDFRGMKVPEVLLNGNHKLISEWREKESLKRTKERRPDLIKTK